MCLKDSTDAYVLIKCAYYIQSDPGGGELFKSGLQSSPYGYDLQMVSCELDDAGYQFSMLRVQHL